MKPEFMRMIVVLGAAAVLSIVCVAPFARAAVSDGATVVRSFAMTSTLAAATSTPTCGDIDPGLWKGRLLLPDAPSQPPPRPLDDGMVQQPPSNVVPMPNECVLEPTTPTTDTNTLHRVNSATP